MRTLVLCYALTDYSKWNSAITVSVNGSNSSCESNWEPCLPNLSCKRTCFFFDWISTKSSKSSHSSFSVRTNYLTFTPKNAFFWNTLHVCSYVFITNENYSSLFSSIKVKINEIIILDQKVPWTYLNSHQNQKCLYEGFPHHSKFFF